MTPAVPVPSSSDSGSVNNHATSVDVVDVIDSLITSWDDYMSTGHGIGATSPRQLAAMLAIGCHCHETAKLVLPYLRGGLRPVHVVLVRAILESAITVAWLGNDPVAAQAFENEAIKKQDTLRNSMSASPTWSPAAASVGTLTSSGSSSRDTEASVFKQRAESIGAQDAYVLYRDLSGLSHPGARLAGEYMEAAKGGYEFSLVPEGVLLEKTYFALVVATALYWCGKPIDDVDPEAPRREQLEEAWQMLTQPSSSSVSGTVQP